MAETASRLERFGDKLKQFKPGQSGNPSGRPKRDRDLAKLLADNTEAALKRLIALTKSDDPVVAIAACKAVLDRAMGKPGQKIKIADGDNPGSNEEPLSDTAQWIEELLRKGANDPAA